VAWASCSMPRQADPAASWARWAIALTFMPQLADTSETMERQRIVVHYLDGRVIKGHTDSFNPAGREFRLAPLDAKGGEVPVVVALNALKAIFFVKNFGGTSDYVEKKEFIPGQPYMGKKLRLTFSDGEVMNGASLNYDPKSAGFFFFPADPQSNIIRVFAISASLKQVELIK
jgi:hypothetical protein